MHPHSAVPAASFVVPSRLRAGMRAAVAFALCTGLLVACGGGETAAPPAKYEVRALVKDVGGEGADARATLQHEAIPTFKDRKGNETGMKAMTMAFGIASGVDRSVLKAGAKVELVVEVDWTREPALMVQKATALPDDTELTLE